MIAFEVTINDDKPIVVGGNNVTTAIYLMDILEQIRFIWVD